MFAQDEFRAVGKLGFFGMRYPEEVGGSGQDVVSYCLAVEEIANSGFEIFATEGTARLVDALGFPVTVVPKVGQGHPDVVECIESGQVDLVFNTVQQEPSVVRDSFAIRRAALTRGLPYFTTLAALRAAAGAIRAMRLGSIGVRALQEVHRRAH